MSMRREFTCIPRDVKCVIESSSVWYEMFRFVRYDLGYDVILSNPAQTKAIAASKKKTDKIDAHILADLLRGGYIAVSHVPDKEIIESRQMVRYRHDKARQRTQCKKTSYTAYCCRTPLPFLEPRSQTHIRVPCTGSTTTG